MGPENQDRRLPDDAIDAALTRYGQAEPVPGLEGRVLANLRAEGERRNSGRNWWPGLGTVAAVLVTAILVISAAIFDEKDHRSSMEVRTETTPIVKQSSPQMPIASAAGMHPASSRKTALPLRASRTQEPRLEQFPSPQPLSEQEQMLARYVEELPSEARQIAEAQTELERKDQLEFEKLGQDRSEDSPQ